MFIKFEVEKNIEATGVLLSMTCTHKMTRMRLLKLLYLANRESIKDTGYPIVDDKFVAMDWGVVMSNTYDCITGRGEIAVQWSLYFATEMDKYVIMEHDPGVDNLSDYAVELLQTVAKRYETVSTAKLSALMHDLDEYKQNWKGGHSSYLVPDIDILRAVGRANDAPTLLNEIDAYKREYQILDRKA